jgi:hypothetical protein
MKNRITSFFLQGLAAGVAAFLAQNAQSQVVYNNTGQNGGTSSGVGSYNYGNGEVGNEIVLGTGSGTFDVGAFTLQFFLTGTTFSGTPSVELNFYSEPANNTAGTAPGALLYSSGFSTLTAFTPASGQTLTYNPDVTVPADFTWTLVFSGVPAGDSAGLSIFNSSTKNGSGIPIPAVGGNYNDAWVNSGTASSPTWTLVQSTPNANSPGLQFGALVTAVPEPSTIALGVIGACSFLARRRKS